LSAKTDDMVYQCFLKVAANVLRIPLTSSDLDASQKVVKANFVPESQSHATPMKKPTKTKSVLCSIQ
jgi:hypothetical protein